LCSAQAISLQNDIEASAWDGEWYMRAWFDDGTPLGTKANSECRIDAIAQRCAVNDSSSCMDESMLYKRLW
jgi:cellobiose phosphorylase